MEFSDFSSDRIGLIFIFCRIGRKKLLPIRSDGHRISMRSVVLFIFVDNSLSSWKFNDFQIKMHFDIRIFNFFNALCIYHRFFIFTSIAQIKKTLRWIFPNGQIYIAHFEFFFIDFLIFDHVMMILMLSFDQCDTFTVFSQLVLILFCNNELFIFFICDTHRRCLCV